MVMIMGYAIIAVPTGIVTAELSRVDQNPRRRRCPHCQEKGHDPDALYCKYCSESLKEPPPALEEN